jgi:hypothetical protein
MGVSVTVPRESGFRNGAGERPLPLKGVVVIAEVVLLNIFARRARWAR